METKNRVVKDYILYDNSGKEVRLSNLFEDHDYLVILHNMGKTCPNCALWGDEFNGMLEHLKKATGFTIVGPDDPKTQKAYAKGRGWKVPLYSAKGTSFIKDMGFEDKKGNFEPGISILQREGEKIILLEQVNVNKDGRAPSVLEIFWMIPSVEVSDLAWVR